MSNDAYAPATAESGLEAPMADLGAIEKRLEAAERRMPAGEGE